MKKRKNLSGASIWVSSENGLYKLADCDAVIEISDQTQMLKLLDSNTEYAVKSYSVALVICSGMKYTVCENVSVELLKTVRSFSLNFDFKTAKKIDEQQIFGNVIIGLKIIKR